MRTSRYRTANPSLDKTHIRGKAPLFPLGQVVATREVLTHFEKHGINAQDYLDRHVRGDWGDISSPDAAQNVYSVREGFRIFSQYTIAQRKVFVVTEADRSSTAIMFPEEY